MKIYISQQTGIPHFKAKESFEKAKAELEKEGHEVINPYRNHEVNASLRAINRKEDLEMLLKADGVYFLSGWKSQQISSIDKEIATQMDKVLLFCREITIESIKDAVIEASGVTDEQLGCRSQKREFVLPRALFSFFCEKENQGTYYKIGTHINRSPFQIWSYLNKLKTDMERNKPTKELAEKINKLLYG